MKECAIWLVPFTASSQWCTGGTS